MRLMMCGHKSLVFSILVIFACATWADAAEQPVEQPNPEVAVPAVAGKPEKPARRGNRRGPRARWWQNQDLAKELDLTPEQITALDHWVRSQRTAHRERNREQDQARKAVSLAIEIGEFELARQKASEASAVITVALMAEIDAAQTYRGLLTQVQLELLKNSHAELLAPPLRSSRQTRRNRGGDDKGGQRQRQQLAPEEKSEGAAPKDQGQTSNQ